MWVKPLVDILFSEVYFGQCSKDTGNPKVTVITNELDRLPLFFDVFTYREKSADCLKNFITPGFELTVD